MYRTLFIDIEVSPNIVLSWATGHRISIGYENIVKERAVICISYKPQGGQIKSLTWDKRQSDKKMLAEFSKIAQDYDLIIGHNGDRFDIKWIRTRCLIQGIHFPHEIHSYDTLKVARHFFRFNSNRLDYLGQLLVGQRKVDNGGFDTWRKVLLDNDREALAAMVKYCEGDVELLEKVYDKLILNSKPPYHMGVAVGSHRWSCPHCSSERVRHRAERVSIAGIVTHRMSCNDCGRYSRVSDSVYRSYLDWKSREKKRNTII